MTPEEYLIECRRTEKRDDWGEITPELANNVRLLYTLIGLATEAGEALDVFKKCFFLASRTFAKESIGGFLH